MGVPQRCRGWLWASGLRRARVSSAITCLLCAAACLSGPCSSSPLSFSWPDAHRHSRVETQVCMCRVLFLPFAQLGALVMYRRSQAGGGGHYKTIVRSPDGWRSYDGMESGGVGVRIRSPEGDHLPRAGHWFPVEVVYERVPG